LFRPKLPSVVRYSCVELFTSPMSIAVTAVSSVAEPVKVIGSPALTVNDCGVVGGVTALGELIDTTGACAVADTVQSR
jgi:hypothetical protein